MKMKAELQCKVTKSPFPIKEIKDKRSVAGKTCPPNCHIGQIYKHLGPSIVYVLMQSQFVMYEAECYFICGDH